MEVTDTDFKVTMVTMFKIILTENKQKLYNKQIIIKTPEVENSVVNMTQIPAEERINE